MQNINELIANLGISNIFETLMLICFGFSWPFNLIRNIRAKSAKGMSIYFILLITAGYIFGIIAKIVTGQINYVLVVYIINIVMVSANIIIYIINYNLDKKNINK